MFSPRPAPTSVLQEHTIYFSLPTGCVPGLKIIHKKLYNNFALSAFSPGIVEFLMATRFVIIAGLVASCGRTGYDPIAQAATCDDNVHNQDETDIDCGGMVCGACTHGNNCRAGDDCTSGVCTTNVCAMPTCNDDVRNQDEMGIDCGGSCPGACLYISPNGSDAAQGTSSDPWRTWSYALGQLGPGDTLFVQDGTYGVSTATGYLSANCNGGSNACNGAPCNSGTADQPITVRAVNERKPFLQWQIGAPTAPITVRGCTHWTLKGLYASNADHDDGGADDGAAIVVDTATDIVIRHMLLAKNNRYRNAPIIDIADSQRVLVEDSEIYDFHRRAIWALRTRDLTFRRNYINSRGYSEIVGGFASNCADRGDRGIFSQGSAGLIIENNVIEYVCKGIEIKGGVSLDAQSGDNHVVIGNIVMRAAGRAFMVVSDCNNTMPCNDPSVIASNNQFVDNIAIDSFDGFDMSGGQNITINHFTSVNHTNLGLHLHRDSKSQGLTSSVFVRNSLAVGAGVIGFQVSGQDNWIVDHANSFDHANNYDSFNNVNDNMFVDAVQLDPVLGACRVYIPTSSPMKDAGIDGADIGANVIFRSQDAILTTMPLWNQTDGRFPCGAIIAGVNDGPIDVCSTVHQRLNVGSNGCPIP